MLETPPYFSVIAPTYNRCDIVEETLRRLVHGDYPNDRFEVLVADNSSDDTPRMVQSMAKGAMARIRLLSSNERLPAIKRNLALREAVGDFVLFINDDLWVGPQFLSAHASAHEEHPGAVAVLGLVEQSARMPWTPFVDWYQPFAYHELEGRECESLPWSYFWSMNISLPRAEMIDRNLVFHTDWSEIGHEDVELGYRWVRAGNSIVFHPEARGEHYHPHSLDTACNLQFTIGRGLRDLERLVPEPMLLERYGVFSWHGSRRAKLRGLARMTLFNGLTVPTAKRWLESRTTYGPLARWMNWKVMLHYTNRGYRRAAQSSTVPLTTDPRGSRLGDE